MFVLGGDEPPFFKTMAKNLTQEEKQSLTTDIENGQMSYVAMQKKYGCSTSTIWRIIKSKSLERGYGVRVWQEEKQEVKRQRGETSHHRLSGCILKSDSFVEDGF